MWSARSSRRTKPQPNRPFRVFTWIATAPPHTVPSEWRGFLLSSSVAPDVNTDSNGIYPKPYYVNYKIRVPKILRSSHASRRARPLRVGVWLNGAKERERYVRLSTGASHVDRKHCNCQARRFHPPGVCFPAHQGTVLCPQVSIMSPSESTCHPPGPAPFGRPAAGRFTRLMCESGLKGDFGTHWRV